MEEQPDDLSWTREFHVRRQLAEELLHLRVEELAMKANEGEMTEAERVEYECYAKVNHYAAILLAKAARENSPSLNDNPQA